MNERRIQFTNNLDREFYRKYYSEAYTKGERSYLREEELDSSSFTVTYEKYAFEAGWWDKKHIPKIGETKKCMLCGKEFEYHGDWIVEWVCIEFRRRVIFKRFFGCPFKVFEKANGRRYFQDCSHYFAKREEERMKKEWQLLQQSKKCLREVKKCLKNLEQKEVLKPLREELELLKISRM